jgi:hypothetical protein
VDRACVLVLADAPPDLQPTLQLSLLLLLVDTRALKVAAVQGRACRARLSPHPSSPFVLHRLPAQSTQLL